jgi:hypothetical protein
MRRFDGTYTDMWFDTGECQIARDATMLLHTSDQPSFSFVNILPLIQ